MKVKNKNDIGNPYHSDYDGKFTSPFGEYLNVDEEDNSPLSMFKGDIKKRTRDYLPKIKNDGTPRTFFNEENIDKQIQILSGAREEFSDIYNEILTRSSNQTILINRNEDRKKWVDEVIAEQEKMPKKNERKAVIVLGLPASGKSTFSEPLMDKMGAYLIDADIMKEKIPEFQENNLNVSAVHEESVMMNGIMLDKIMAQGGNIVIGKIGGFPPESIQENIKRLHTNGYDIKVVFNDIPYDVAIERNISRFRNGKTKRLVPIYNITNNDNDIHRSYDELIGMDEVSGGMVFSNDVPFGQKPKTIKKDKDSEELEEIYEWI